jgi:NAD(P)-dependent dehydrogenase (short-subunit alcohol dehydrogenase family)
VTISGIALVSGASRGLGAHIARRLAADGRAVAVNYRGDADGAARVVDDIVAAGGRAAAFRADVTDEDEVRAMTAAVEQELGTVQVVVANAPGWIPVERHGEVSAEDSAGYVADVPLRRLGTPQEIADVVAFVASDAARFVTGERITVNGGHTID